MLIGAILFVFVIANFVAYLFAGTMMFNDFFYRNQLYTFLLLSSLLMFFLGLYVHAWTFVASNEHEEERNSSFIAAISTVIFLIVIAMCFVLGLTLEISDHKQLVLIIP